jgi:hypothetical protein
MSAAKMGRPTDNPRNIQLRIRINKDEAKIIEECESYYGINKTAVVIKGLKELHKNIKK